MSVRLNEFRHDLADERHAFSEQVVTKGAQVETIQSGYRVKDEVMAGQVYRRYVFEGMVADPDKALHILVPDAFLSMDGQQPISNQLAALNRRAVLLEGPKGKPQASAWLLANIYPPDISKQFNKQNKIAEDVILLAIRTHSQCEGKSCYFIRFIPAGEELWIKDSDMFMGHQFPVENNMSPQLARNFVYYISALGYVATIPLDIATFPLQIIYLFNR
jgi:hypothetical protein